MENKTKLKSTANLILNTVLYIFLAICIIAVFVTLISKKDDDGMEIFGHQMLIVTSESMDKCDETDVSDYRIGSIPLNSMVFVQTVPDDAAKAEEWYADIEVGDVLTFKYLYTSHITITHRVTRIDELDGGGYKFYLEGDNKDANSDILTQTIDTTDETSPNFIIGKVVAKSYLLGLLISFLQKPVGIVLVVIVPCFIIIMMEVFRIIGVVNEDKKKKAEEEKKKKDDEIEELKRRLSAFEDPNTENKGDTDQQTTVEEGKQ
ncbi:MAG: hypothetical protein IJ011_08900 [Clostridia bacterium]|nr:hypothetical protein [Clostridia bacterium]